MLTLGLILLALAIWAVVSSHDPENFDFLTGGEDTTALSQGESAEPEENAKV